MQNELNVVLVIYQSLFFHIPQVEDKSIKGVNVLININVKTVSKLAAKLQIAMIKRARITRRIEEKGAKTKCIKEEVVTILL